jgi:molybdopterin-synthase adenylyltransferase
VLADGQIERYSRQIILPQVGGKGQEKLLRARVLVGGVGPSQDVALFYLAAAGVGTLGVRAGEESVLFSELARESPDAQTTVLRRLNPDCAVVRHSGDDGGDIQHLSRLVQDYTLVLSGPDVRLHEACYVARRPLLCAQTTGTLCWFFTCRGYEASQPCLQCVTPPSGGGASPLFEGCAAAFLGAQVATEVVKIVLGLDRSDDAKLFRCEFPDLRFHVRGVGKNPDCPCCGRKILP